MSLLSAPLPGRVREASSLGEAIAIDCRAMELRPRYGFRLAYEIAWRERLVHSEADLAELRVWAENERSTTRSSTV